MNANDPTGLFEFDLGQIFSDTVKEISSWFDGAEDDIAGSYVDDFEPQFQGFHLENPDLINEKLWQLPYSKILEPSGGLQGAMETAAGLGDRFSSGYTEDIRKLLGTSNEINKDSLEYQSAYRLSAPADFAIPGAALQALTKTKNIGQFVQQVLNNTGFGFAEKFSKGRFRIGVSQASKSFFPGTKGKQAVFRIGIGGNHINLPLLHLGPLKNFKTGLP
ncbi:MAG: hypothetical protein COV66_15390 [Nitrospinae bacterium CG11_big_fil_rev_8_21_14_0_20_45_15]|nr:MAG: hypothetical protein COV66_15390 [Nitrospinae bacterium CG11_big_fil_rev_8_21_14_0_20_45_15]